MSLLTDLEETCRDVPGCLITIRLRLGDKKTASPEENSAMTKLKHQFEVTLAQFADGPSLLESAISGLTESNLDLALNPDSWSIRQIVHHVSDGDDIWKICIKAALGNPQGCFSFQWYWDRPQTEWAENWKYSQRSLESSLELLCASRRQILDLIRSIPQAWEKSIRLKKPDGQEECISVGEMIEIQARHVIDHIHDIQKIRRANRL